MCVCVCWRRLPCVCGPSQHPQTLLPPCGSSVQPGEKIDPLDDSTFNLLQRLCASGLVGAARVALPCVAFSRARLCPGGPSHPCGRDDLTASQSDELARSAVIHLCWTCACSQKGLVNLLLPSARAHWVFIRPCPAAVTQTVPSSCGKPLVILTHWRSSWLNLRRRSSTSLLPPKSCWQPSSSRIEDGAGFVQVSSACPFLPHSQTP